MVKVIFTDRFKRLFSKINNNLLKEKIIKKIEKIRDNPEIGKPMRYSRKGTRELYIAPLRLSYSFIIHEETVYLLDLYHKDGQ